MGSAFTVEPREGYLYMHLEPAFELTAESAARVWTALSDGCREHRLRKALAECDNMQRKLTPMESFDVATLAGTLMPGISIACCFRGYSPDEQTKFFRTAAMNRGVRVEFFQDLNAALRWLAAGG